MKISIIGSGKVATHLATSFIENDIQVSHIYGRNVDRLNALCKSIDAKAVTSIQDLPNQLCILCISDDAISEVIQKINPTIPVAYTSGSVKISSIKERDNIGVFYPLQTFTKDRKVNFFEIPIFIESNNEYFTQTLFDLAWNISRTVNYATSEERAKLHLAAVFVNNFTNHILCLAQEICAKEGVDFNHLRPLLKETISKIDHQPALNNQTGPAKRRDKQTIDFQENQLSGNVLEVYETLTKSILNTYKRENEL